MKEIVETRSSRSNTIKYTSTIMCNPSLYIYSGKGLRIINIVLVYLLVYLLVLLRELLVSAIFCMVHPYIAID